ncbi:hypothetical protein HDU91_003821, partial [Kappamyces sp. JEL0680]
MFARALVGLGLSSLLAWRGIRKGNLTVDGGLCAISLCWPLYTLNPAFGWLLISFYLVGSRVTHFKHQLKARQEECSTTRNWYQVYCNTIVLLTASSAYYFFPPYRKQACIVALSSVACCCGDTFASEIGSVMSSSPVLITSGKPAPPGQNGAVSVPGTLASVAGGALMGLVYLVLATLFPLEVVPFGAAQVVITGAFSGFI